jgi:thioredoxin reductase
VLDTGSHGALLLRMWTDDVTLLTNGGAVEPDELEKLEDAGITVDARPIAQLEGPGDALTGVHFAGGERRALTGLLARVTLHQRTPLAQQLGAELAEPGQLAADGLVVDGQGRTTVPGLFAAGDTTAHMPSVANAIAAGSTAGAMIVGDLVAEQPTVRA